MLKKIMMILTMFFAITTLNSTVGVAEMPLRVVVNGEKIYFPDAQPFIDANGRTQVPVRFVSEALGAKVDWNGDTKKVSVALNSRNVILTIGLKKYEINNQSYQMDTVALLQESRTFVPIRFVSEALGASVVWDQATKSVYIKFDANASPAPLPTPQTGTVNYYDGIAFNNVTDVDEYGRIKVEKSKEFVLKLASQLSFIKENGKYYIKCDYPEIPEGYEWSLGIIIFNKDGSSIGYNSITRIPGCQIPTEGSFKKEATHVTNLNNVNLYNISISINHKEMDNTGLLNIVCYRDSSIKEKKAKFIPTSGIYPSEDYTETFDYKKMFQW